MAEVIVTLTSLEKKPGSNANGDYVLWLFKGLDSDGQEKRFQTFIDDIGKRAEELMNKPVRLEFHTQQRPYTDRNGVSRVGNNNVIDAISLASEAAPQVGSAPVAAASSVEALRMDAFGHAIKTIELGLISFDESPTFTDVTSVADAIVAYAQGELAVATEPVAAEAVTD